MVLIPSPLPACAHFHRVVYNSPAYSLLSFLKTNPSFIMPSTDLQICGFYSPSLSSHPAWGIIQPVLKGCKSMFEGSSPSELTAFALHETATPSPEKPPVLFDLAFKLGHPRKKILEVLILSPSCMRWARRTTTAGNIKRLLDHCEHMEAAKAAIVFIFAEDLSSHQSDKKCPLKALIDLQGL